MNGFGLDDMSSALDRSESCSPAVVALTEAHMTTGDDDEDVMESWSEILDVQRALCVAMAVLEILDRPELDNDQFALAAAAAAAVIVSEAEQFEPDFVKLYCSWERALHAWRRLTASCKVGAMGLLLLEHLEERPGLRRS